MGRVVIWRDKVDKHQFSIGHDNGTVIKWLDVWDEAISVVCGESAYDALQTLTPGGEPVEVRLALAFGETEAGR